MQKNDRKGGKHTPKLPRNGYMTIREAMAKYGCCESTYRRWVREKLVHAVVYRRCVFIREKDLANVNAVHDYQTVQWTPTLLGLRRRRKIETPGV